MFSSSIRGETGKESLEGSDQSSLKERSQCVFRPHLGLTRRMETQFRKSLIKIGEEQCNGNWGRCSRAVVYHRLTRTLDEMPWDNVQFFTPTHLKKPRIACSETLEKSDGTVQGIALEKNHCRKWGTVHDLYNARRVYKELLSLPPLSDRQSTQYSRFRMGGLSDCSFRAIVGERRKKGRRQGLAPRAEFSPVSCIALNVNAHAHSLAGTFSVRLYVCLNWIVGRVFPRVPLALVSGTGYEKRGRGV